VTAEYLNNGTKGTIQTIQDQSRKNPSTKQNVSYESKAMIQVALPPFSYEIGKPAQKPENSPSLLLSRNIPTFKPPPPTFSKFLRNP